MSTQVVSVTVNTVSYQVGMGVAKYVKDLKAALKAGNPVADAIAVASATITDIAPLISQLPEVAIEAVASPANEAATAFVVGEAIVAAVMS